MFCFHRVINNRPVKQHFLGRFVAFPQAPLADIAKAWSVADVSQFLRQRDAAGIAAVFERNAVNAEDFLAFPGAEDLERDLRLTPFAARKVVRLRAELLGRPL